MTRSSPILSRRRALTLGAAFGGALALTPTAQARPTLRYPLSILYARVGKEGFETPPQFDQDTWTSFQVQLGGLIRRIEPIVPYKLLPSNLPETDGGATCALVARKLASDGGYDAVLLYSVDDGKKTYNSYNNWLSRAFSKVRTNLTPDKNTTGEAHLLALGGGAPILSVTAQSPNRKWFNPLDNYRKPNHEALTQIEANLKQRLQSHAQAAYELSRSIAD